MKKRLHTPALQATPLKRGLTAVKRSPSLRSRIARGAMSPRFHDQGDSREGDHVVVEGSPSLRSRIARGAMFSCFHDQGGSCEGDHVVVEGSPSLRKGDHVVVEGVIFLLALLFATMLFANPIIGGFSVSAPMMCLSDQPYNLYYYPGLAYEASYSASGDFVAGIGFNFPIPWMNFSQIPITKSELPIALAIARSESGFQNYSRSRVGAEGLMQFMPQTAAEYGVSNPFDPFESVQGALNYIEKYETRFSSLKLAFAAYNAGPGAVAKYKGVPPYPETQNYVKKVMKYVSEYSNSTQYPNIYARIGVFAQYNSSGKTVVGFSYPLSPGQVDLCPMVTFDSTSMKFSWIWRVSAGKTHVALNHSNNGDQIEISSEFGPLTAILGEYKNGLAASGILDLWGHKFFGSISASGDVRYGLALNVFGIYVEAWKDKENYEFALNGRW
ncbi:MAG: transglycosylase SLT domain-containing protein [Nitrospiraceae bacterium]|nr:transglycosylase SLT domain-containing protein [Nitrospiraceae bacterium]